MISNDVKKIYPFLLMFIIFSFKCFALTPELEQLDRVIQEQEERAKAEQMTSSAAQSKKLGPPPKEAPPLPPSKPFDVAIEDILKEFETKAKSPGTSVEQILREVEGAKEISPEEKQKVIELESFLEELSKKPEESLPAVESEEVKKIQNDLAKINNDELEVVGQYAALLRKLGQAEQKLKDNPLSREAASERNKLVHDELLLSGKSQALQKQKEKLEQELEKQKKPKVLQEYKAERHEAPLAAKTLPKPPQSLSPRVLEINKARLEKNIEENLSKLKETLENIPENIARKYEKDINSFEKMLSTVTSQLNEVKNPEDLKNLTDGISIAKYMFDNKLAQAVTTYANRNILQKIRDAIAELIDDMLSKIKKAYRQSSALPEKPSLTKEKPEEILKAQAEIQPKEINIEQKEKALEEPLQQTKIDLLNEVNSLQKRIAAFKKMNLSDPLKSSLNIIEEEAKNLYESLITVTIEAELKEVNGNFLPRIKGVLNIVQESINKSKKSPLPESVLLNLQDIQATFKDLENKINSLRYRKK